MSSSNFFSHSSNVEASHSTFNAAGRDQHNYYYPVSGGSAQGGSASGRGTKTPIYIDLHRT
jgi:hypothetical protein